MGSEWLSECTTTTTLRVLLEKERKDFWGGKNKTIMYILKCKEGGAKMVRGIGWGDHFLPHKFIERTFERWANYTKQLLIVSRGYQVHRKAAHCLCFCFLAHCLWKEVGQNIKDKKRDKRVRDGEPSWEGSLNRGSFQTPGNPLTGRSGGSFWISEGNLTGGKNK